MHVARLLVVVAIAATVQLGCARKVTRVAPEAVKPPAPAASKSVTAAAKDPFRKLRDALETAKRNGPERPRNSRATPEAEAPVLAGIAVSPASPPTLAGVPVPIATTGTPQDDAPAGTAGQQSPTGGASGATQGATPRVPLLALLAAVILGGAGVIYRRRRTV